MFQHLTDRMQSLFRRLRGHGVLTEKHLREVSAELREALLAADVHHTVVDQFVAQVDAAALGQEVVKSLSPADLYLKIVFEALTTALGGATEKLTFGSKPPVVIMLVGLQGSGKTTTAAKLAQWCQAQGRRPLLVPLDLARPAAIAQLQTLGAAANLPVYPSVVADGHTKILSGAFDQARTQLFDTIILDTAGRLHIDDALMQELGAIRARAQPAHTLLVVDAMAGQQGLVAAQGFHAPTPLTGVIMSKADGDARGGVALSTRAVLGVPIFFTGQGEKIEALELFYPDRMASRILDMGDLQGLAEKVETITDRATAESRVRKLASGRFTMEDYREQLKDIAKVGQWEGMLKMIPGMGRVLPQINMDAMKGELTKKEAIINSMTFAERSDVRLLNGSRRKRIAAGSGTSVTEVNRLIKEFELLSKMMKKGPGGQKQMAAQMMQMMGK